MIKKNSLSFRIISRVLIITITLFILILGGYYFYTRSIIKQKTKEYAIQLAGNIAGKIVKHLQPMEEIPEMMSATLEFGAFQPDSIINVLKKVVQKNPDIFGASVAFEPGIIKGKPYFMPYAFREGNEIKSIMLGGPTYEYFTMDWYQIPLMLQKPYWSEPYFDDGATKVQMATYSVPFYIHTPKGLQLAGITTIDMGLDWLSDIVSKEHIFKTGYTYILSRNGLVITHPDKKLIMNESIFSVSVNMDDPLLREIGRDLIKGKSNFRDYNLKGRANQWIYYTNLPSGMWSIGVVFPDKEMYASLQQMNLALIVVIFLSLLLLTYSTVRVVNRQTSPLLKITESARLIAQGNFNVEIPTFKSNEEMEQLGHAFSHMQKELSVYVENLKETTSAKEKIESELRIARDIQMAMIPHTFPPFPNLPQIDLFALLKSAKEVGGDLYDFFLIDPTRFCFAIGDVSGKGVPASLFMAVTRTLMRSIADKQKEPAAIVRDLNKALSLNNDSCMFVTFFCGILDLENGQLTYTNAGHNPPIIIRKNGSVETLAMPTSIPLGLMEEYPYTDLSITLDNGDKIFAYTDGVSEAENEAQQLFGEDIIVKVVSKNAKADPRMLIHEMEIAVESHVLGHVQSDDITMMTISYNG